MKNTIARSLLTASIALALGGCGDAVAEVDAGTDDGPPMAPTCGEGLALDPSFMTATGVAVCNALDVVTVPLDVTFAAAPVGPVNAGAATDVEVQVVISLSEEVITGTLGNVVDVAEIGEASGDADAGDGSPRVNIPAGVPCAVDFAVDPDDNGTPGPVAVTTPVVTQAWTESEGSLTVQLTDVTFAIETPVPLTLSTTGDMPACEWEDGEIPSLTFAVP